MEVPSRSRPRRGGAAQPVVRHRTPRLPVRGARLHAAAAARRPRSPPRTHHGTSSPSTFPLISGGDVPRGRPPPAAARRLTTQSLRRRRPPGRHRARDPRPHWFRVDTEPPAARCPSRSPGRGPRCATASTGRLRSSSSRTSPPPTGASSIPPRPTPRGWRTSTCSSPGRQRRRALLHDDVGRAVGSGHADHRGRGAGPGAMARDDLDGLEASSSCSSTPCVAWPTRWPRPTQTRTHPPTSTRSCGA